MWCCVVGVVLVVVLLFVGVWCVERLVGYVVCVVGDCVVVVVLVVGGRCVVVWCGWGGPLVVGDDCCCRWLMVVVVVAVPTVGVMC